MEEELIKAGANVNAISTLIWGHGPMGGHTTDANSQQNQNHQNQKDMALCSRLASTVAT